MIEEKRGSMYLMLRSTLHTSTEDYIQMTGYIVDPVDVLARTLWGEGRSTGTAGMQHIASVILNRAAHPRWWGNNVCQVCTQPWQFSCRNDGDPNWPKLRDVTMQDQQFLAAVSVARLALAGMVTDVTKGADSYYALSMHTPPAWAAKATHTFSDGWHAFYRTTGALSTQPAGDARNVSVHALPPSEADALNAEVLKTLAQ